MPSPLVSCRHTAPIDRYPTQKPSPGAPYRYRWTLDRSYHTAVPTQEHHWDVPTPLRGARPFVPVARGRAVRRGVRRSVVIPRTPSTPSTYERSRCTVCHMRMVA